MTNSRSGPPDRSAGILATPLVRTAAVLVGLVTGYLTVALVLARQPAQHFGAPVAGALAFEGGRKGGDLVAPVLAVVLGVAVGIAVKAAIESQPDRRRRDMVVQYLWWACPGVIAVGAVMAGSGLPISMAAVTVGASLLMAYEVLVSARRRAALPPLAVSASALGCLLWGMVPLAIGVGIGRSSSAGAELSESVPWPALAVASSCAAMVYEIWGAVRGRPGMESPGRLFISLPQCVLPLLILAFVPARLRLLDGGAADYPTDIALPVLAWSLAAVGVLACLFDLRRRQRRKPTTDREPRLMSPAALLPLLLAGLVGDTRGPAVSFDDYHYGETLIGWFRYQAGALPYVDHQPAHGLVQDDMAAMVCSLFFDGSAASHAEASRLCVAGLAALLFAVVLWATASQLLAVVVTVIGVVPSIVAPVEFTGLTWIFLLIAGWLLVAPRLRARPQRWLLVWVLLVPVLILGAPAQGLVLALAGGALALRSAGQVLRHDGVRGLALPGAGAALLLVTSVATPLGAMLAAALTYVVTNAGINTEAYGIPWNASVLGSSTRGLGLFDALRMLWLAGLALCSVVALRELRARRWTGEVLAQAVFFGMLLGGVLPYVMGRVDVGGPARAGYATILTLTLVIPAMTWWRLRSQPRAVLALGVVAAATSLFGVSVNGERVGAAATPFVPAGAVVDGSTLGLPGWGLAAPRDAAVLEQASRLARILDSELEPGAPYFDATSRNAQYFYVGRRPVVSVPAVYNTPDVADQRRTIRQLSDAEPGLVVLAQPLGNIIHDGGGVALRTPLLTRYLERTYTPYLQDGFILGRRGAPPAVEDQEVVLALDEAVDAEWDRGVSRTSAAIRFDDPQAAAMVPAGARLRLPDGSGARVTSSAGGIVQLSRVLPATANLAQERGVRVNIADLDPRLYRLWLFERAFGKTDLEELPTAWGRSVDDIGGLDLVSDLDVEGRLNPGTPHVAVPLPDSTGGRDVDMVSFDTQCEGTGDPVLSLTWSSPGLSAEELPGRAFTAANGEQLVPLDSSAFWRGAETVDELVLRVVDGVGCTEVSISDVSVWKRSD
jgi:hypothetical protein